MDISKLSRETLFNLIMSYDTYIQDANEENRYREEWFPVCISEYYDNEFQLEED